MLLGQTRGVRPPARVCAHLQILHVFLSCDTQPQPIRPGQHHRPVGGDVTHPPERRHTGESQVPREQVQSRLRGDAGRCRRPVRPRLVVVLQRIAEDRVNLGAVGDPGAVQAVGARPLYGVGAETVGPRHRVLQAAERADHLSRRVEDVERHLLAAGLEPVVDDRAAGRVLPHRMGRVLTPPTPVHAVGVAGVEQVGVARQRGVGELAQRCDIVEDPERAAVSGRDQVAVLDREVVDRDERQVAPQRLPVPAVVE